MIFENMETCATVEFPADQYSYSIKDGVWRDVGSLFYFLNEAEVAAHGGVTMVGVAPIEVGLYHLTGFFETQSDAFIITDADGELSDICALLA